MTYRLDIAAQAERQPGQCVLRLNGKLEMETATAFEKEVCAQMAPVVILDFAGVTFIGAAGKGALVQIY